MPTRITCPACQAPVTLSRDLAGRRVRCPHCRTIFSVADNPAHVKESESIAARPIAPAGSEGAAPLPVESAEDWPDIRLEMRCEGCGHTLSFSTSDIGTVQECPECGGYIDIPEVGRPPTNGEIEAAARTRTAREWELQSKETTRQLDLTAKQIEQTQQALDRRDAQDVRYEEILDRLEQLLAFWEQLAERAGRVIDRMKE